MWYFTATGQLKTEWDDLCLDYNYGNQNVYMHPCHGGANQLWVHPQRTLNAAVPVAAGAPAGELKTEWDANCLDYNTGNGNVIMWDCHGAENQQWHINPDGTMGTAWDNKCLDYNYNDMNVYMHPCHGGANQIWVHPQRTANIAAAQPEPMPIDDKPGAAPGEETYYSSEEEYWGDVE